MRLFGIVLACLLALATAAGGLLERGHAISAEARPRDGHALSVAGHSNPGAPPGAEPSMHCGVACPSIVPRLPATSERIEWHASPFVAAAASIPEGYIQPVPRRPPRA
ncbi:hypothetical protein [Aureimonas sp. N4]|uniref:hypothetical protein n=1 Tax=Aureimonas sp. N4 TaxID=1638165 RepID=UPI00078539B6|nr:hypothetical protein [Aureimonas sp. N4]